MSVVEVPQPQPDKILTYPQLVEKIRLEADLSEDEMNELRRVGRMPGWDVEGACPIFPQTHVVHAMFVGENGDRVGDHLPGDVRAYVRPKQLVGPDGELSPFFRFTMNRGAGTATRTDALPPAAWIEDVAFEFNASIVEDEDEDDEEETPTCKRPGCGAELESDARFCHRCATPVRKCGNCSHVAELSDRFCAGCGVPLVSPPQSALPSSP